MRTKFDRPSYIAFWGKAGDARQDQAPWHPLVCHSLDVAACADALLEAYPRRLAGMADLLSTSPQNALRFIVTLIALHDVGKFMREFQAKSVEAWSAEGGVGTVLGAHKEPSPSRHDVDGFAMFDELDLLALLAQQATVNWVPTDLSVLWTAVTGHHGMPVNDPARSSIAFFDQQCLDAANAFARDVCALLGPVEQILQPARGRLETLSWLLCGLTVVADWAGSNRDWFPYAPPPASLGSYWETTRSRARSAIGIAGLLPSPAATDVGPGRLVPEIAVKLRLSPLQSDLATRDLPDEPLLAIVEDVTGAGKTEAALLLAARLMQSARADGLYFALPTMATANAMYERLAPIYGRLFADGARASLVLSHGKRALNERFTDTVLDAGTTGDGYEEGASATCAAWVADDRRKAFLAQIGVGTIDQAILSVLPSKHQALRLWGLASKVLIIDEAHAYDAYMSREMERLLEFHAALGGSAIVLSATLPAAQRHGLCAAFAKGLGMTHPRIEAADYPLLTLVSAGAQVVHALPSRADRARDLTVRRLNAIEQAVDYIVDMAARGCAVAWIRNAVDDAIEAVSALEARGLSPVLLHARFAMGDRLDREMEVTRTLGREDRTGRRSGFVLVGTQILEQSLDYDVDAMVTDLAPIDLLIQRAGRLWRHTDRSGRPHGMVGPVLCVLSPDPEKVEDADWYHQTSKRSAAVYADHGIVWRSARRLFDAESINTPDGVRGLVEAVYGADGLDDIPEPLRAASQRRAGADNAARAFANANLLKREKGYGGEVGVWTSDTITPTRLGEMVTVFRLARIEAGRVVPYYSDDKPARAWALSEVSLRAAVANGVPMPEQALSAIVEAAKSQWPDWERDMPLLPLEPDETNGWRGTVSMDGKPKIVLYDKQLGLRIA